MRETVRPWPALAARSEAAVVFMLLALGCFLRVWRLDLGWFGVDQARDIATGLDVAAGLDLPTLGPTMRRVTRLGALYYYVWTLPFLVWRNPVAAYGFAAVLNVAALVATWRFARRWWGVGVGIVTLAVAAVHPVWIIDGRIAWSPAALPAASVALLWLVVAPERNVGGPSFWRGALLGAALGVSVQLHLSMAAWVLAAAMIVVVDRWPIRALAAATVGGLVTGVPALWAMFGADGGDAGIATLATRGPWPDIGGRLVALMALPWRLPAAFAAWPEAAGGAGDRLLVVGAATLTLLTIGGMVTLMARLWRDRAARAVGLVIVTMVGIVTSLRGDVWYYYLDALLPLWALTAGMAFVPPPRGWSAPWPRAMAALVCVTALVVGARLVRWIGDVDAAGYVPVAPAALTLDGVPGADASVAGRLLTVAAKRRVTERIAVGAGDFERVWLRLHGPALGDLINDNGFWVRWFLSDASPGIDTAKHIGVWYRDRLGTARPGPDLVADGPLLVVAYEPAIDYASCHAKEVPVTVPIRMLPHPRRYGTGRPEHPRSLPRRIDCQIKAGRGWAEIVAALDGAGSVVLAGPDGRTTPEGRESTLCVRRGAVPVRIHVDIHRDADQAASFDLYEVPSASGCKAGV